MRGLEEDSQSLDGLKVIDFTRIFSGPLCTQILGDLGADVIKLEDAHGGDDSRHYGQDRHGDGFGGSFLALNRNKRSIAVDLATDRGRTVARRLIDDADVLVENFRPGVMTRLALDYESVAERNPTLVYCSITGFGASGDLAHKAANDLIIQAYSGLMSFTGEPGGRPVRCATTISDFSAGLYATIGILAALAQREQHGRGQFVSTSLLESQVAMMSYFFSEYWLNGTVPRPMGTANRLGLPNQAFPVKDGQVVITASTSRMWHRCCQALGIPEVADDPRFSTLSSRYKHRDELIDAISGATRSMPMAECLQALEREGVSCGPINTLNAAANDPQLEHLGAFVNVERGDGQTAKVVDNPIRFSDVPIGAYRPIPAHGEHTDEVLETLGYSAEEIADLHAEGVVTGT